MKPGDPPRLVSDERAAEMLAEFDEKPTAFEDPRQPGWGEHMRRMIELRMPTPQPEQDCWICPHARTIVAFERVGWLVPPPETTKRSPSNATLQRKPREAEREAERSGSSSPPSKRATGRPSPGVQATKGPDRVNDQVRLVSRAPYRLTAAEVPPRLISWLAARELYRTVDRPDSGTGISCGVATLGLSTKLSTNWSRAVPTLHPNA